MPPLRRLPHVCLRADDLDAGAARGSSRFGLTERDRRPGRAYLACDYEPYSLELVQAVPAGHDHTGYELARGITLDDATAHLTRLGVQHHRDENALHLQDPDGTG